MIAGQSFNEHKSVLVVALAALPRPSLPGLLAWTKRIDYPKVFSSLFPIYLFISLTLNNPS